MLMKRMFQEFSQTLKKKKQHFQDENYSHYKCFKIQEDMQAYFTYSLNTSIGIYTEYL